MTKTLKVTYLGETRVSFDKGKTYIATCYDPRLDRIGVIDESGEAYIYSPRAFKNHGDYKQLPIKDNRVRR